jgi:hypothetical protein
MGGSWAGLEDSGSPELNSLFREQRYLALTIKNYLKLPLSPNCMNCAQLNSAEGEDIT